MSFYKEVPGRQTTLESALKFDTEPKAGSTNPVTSEGVKGAIDGAVGDASEALQEQIDDIAEKAGSGYIPKGEASVATLNGLTGQENGWLYTMTDAGTLTDGSLAVVAGDTVAWDATNSVWYKAMNYAPAQYGTNEVHNLPTTITDFRTGDYIAVDGTDTAKMSKNDLLRVTAENAVDSGVAAERTMADEIEGMLGTYAASTYSDQSTITGKGIDDTGKVVSDTYHKIRYIAVSVGDLIYYHVRAWSNRDVRCAFYESTPSANSVGAVLFTFPAPESTTDIDFYVTAPASGYIAISISTNSESQNKLSFGTKYKRISDIENSVKSIDLKTLGKESEIVGNLSTFGINVYSDQSTITGKGIDDTGKIVSDTYHKIRYIAVSVGDLLQYNIKAWTNRDVKCAFYTDTPGSSSVGTILYEFPAPESTTNIDFFVTAPANGYMAISISTNSEGGFKLTFGNSYEKISALEEKVLPIEENVYKNTIENPVNWICRLGWQVYYANTPPQQSIPSYKLAYDRGCRFMLADLRITSDGYFVCCHDDVVNSYIRNPDGTEVVGDVSVSASTLAELNAYDWGLYKGQEWEGLNVLQVPDFIKFCRYKNIGCFIEVKVSMTHAQIDSLASMVKMAGIEKNFMVRFGDLADAEYISTILPKSIVGFGWGNLTQTKIDDVKNSTIPKGYGFVGFSTMSTYTATLGQYAADNDVSLWFSEITDATDLSDFETLGGLDGVGYVSSRINLLAYLASKYE